MTIADLMPPSVKWLAARLRDLCEAESQAAIGQRTTLGQGPIGRIVRNEANPTLESLDTIARGLRIPAWQLIRPLKEPTRQALEDRAIGIIERIPSELLPKLVSTLEGLDGMVGREDDSQDPDAGTHPPPRPRRLK